MKILKQMNAKIKRMMNMKMTIQMQVQQTVLLKVVKSIKTVNSREMNVHIKVLMKVKLREEIVICFET